MRRTLLVAVLLVAVCVPVRARPRRSCRPGFTETTVWSGLGNPTVVRFAPDGRVFVATKAGMIYTFDGVDDPTPTVFADLRDRVQDFWDRGLLGLAIAPDGRVFVAYSHDTGWGDSCPDGGTAPPGCKIDGRLSRIDASGVEHVLITDFCQQFPSHSVGTLAFGPDGMLYLSAGEGAHFDYADFGQIGNVCGDPPNPGGDIGPPDSQGGALRAQAFRRPLAQPFTPDGTDPAHRSGPPADRPFRRRGVWLPQPVPVHVPAGHERDLDGRRRLDDVGGAQPRAARRDRAQLRLALLRGRRRAARLRRAQRHHVRVAVRAKGPRRRRTSPTTTRPTWSPATAALRATRRSRR